MTFQTDFIKKLERKMHDEFNEHFGSKLFKPDAEWRRYDELLLERQRPISKVFESASGEKIQMRRPEPYKSK